MKNLFLLAFMALFSSAAPASNDHSFHYHRLPLEFRTMLMKKMDPKTFATYGLTSRIDNQIYMNSKKNHPSIVNLEPFGIDGYFFAEEIKPEHLENLSMDRISHLAFYHLSVLDNPTRLLYKNLKSISDDREKMVVAVALASIWDKMADLIHEAYYLRAEEFVFGNDGAKDFFNVFIEEKMNSLKFNKTFEHLSDVIPSQISDEFEFHIRDQIAKLIRADEFTIADIIRSSLSFEPLGNPELSKDDEDKFMKFFDAQVDSRIDFLQYLFAKKLFEFCESSPAENLLGVKYTQLDNILNKSRYYMHESQFDLEKINRAARSDAEIAVKSNRMTFLQAIKNLSEKRQNPCLPHCSIL